MSENAESNEERIERRDALRIELSAMRQELRDHVTEEMPALRAMMQELGSPEQVRERRIFIEILIDRDRDGRKLRTALIEKGLLVSLVALIAFIVTAIWHEIGAAIKLMIGKP